MQRLAEESGAVIVQRLRETPGADSLRMTVDIWVGPEDLPARVALEMTAPEETSGGTRITMDVLEYDVPVDAEPPPKGKVADAAAIGGG